MSYEKQGFVEGQVLEANHLNIMETGIAEAHDATDEVAKALQYKAGNDHNHDEAYDAKGAAETAAAAALDSANAYTNGKVADANRYADDKMASANKYTDDKIANVMNNSSDAVDSVLELAAVMGENKEAIEALEEIAGNKAPKEHEHDGRYFTESEVVELLKGFLALTGGILNGSLTIKDSDIILKFAESAKSIHFHQGNSEAPTVSIIATENNSMQIGGGTWGNLCINGKDGCFYPVGSGNYSLGSDGSRFYTLWSLNAPNVSSLAELKTAIHPFTSALEELANTDVYTYKRIDNIERNGDDITHVGFVIGDKYRCSDMLLGDGQTGIDLYNAIGIAVGAIKELHGIVEQQQNTIKELQNKQA